MSSIAVPSPGADVALIALIPVGLAATISFSLRVVGAGEFSEFGAAVVTILAGAPIFRRELRKEKRVSGHVGAPRTIMIGVGAGLGAAVFLLIDIITSMFGYGSLGFFGGSIPDSPAGQFLAASIRGLPLQFGLTFLVATWLGHRLRQGAGLALKVAVPMYILLEIILNIIINNIGYTGVTVQDHIVPTFLSFIVTAASCFAGWYYARRTQERFDKWTQAPSH
jgi:hypothetical protein